ncbi:unnamed protein product [Polarella glacialis]|uniref:Uncharacterized protein n=1 Tax=Polarella glacialis TaxID=89957 RepID=A0A813F6U3_POLGL|nr:unnamed protein product [Polarella glacialis]
MSCFLYVVVILVSVRIYEMPTLVSVPLHMTLGLILLSGPACSDYVSCWFSFRMHGGPNSNQGAGQEVSQEASQEPGHEVSQEANQEPGENESREETHWDEGDCGHVLEPREPQGATSMNIMVPRPEADGSSLTTTQVFSVFV